MSSPQYMKHIQVPPLEPKSQSGQVLHIWLPRLRYHFRLSLYLLHLIKKPPGAQAPQVSECIVSNCRSSRNGGVAGRQ